MQQNARAALVKSDLPFDRHAASSNVTAKGSKLVLSNLTSALVFTLFESENERQKIEPVPIPLPRASRNFPDVKTRNEIFFHNWTSEIIPFIRFGMQMDGT